MSDAKIKSKHTDLSLSQTLEIVNSLGPIATKVVNSVCNPEGLRNEKT